MQQGRRVDEFNDSRHLYAVRALVTTCARGKKNQNGPQSLSAARNDVFGDGSNQGNVGMQSQPDQSIQFFQILGKQRTYCISR